jgi:hypothetical protein
VRLVRYKKPESVAREIARRRGVEGRWGGWLYNRKGERICHGFYVYAKMLLREKAILELANGYVIAEDAERKKKPTRRRRPAPAWGSGIGNGRRGRANLDE